MEEKLKSIELHAILSALNLFPYWLAKHKILLANVNTSKELVVNEVEKIVKDFMEDIQKHGIDECFQNKVYDFFKVLRK
jgi:hypothetical protein